MRLKMSKIIVIWDAMIDKYIFWNTDRKNPESPMPLLNVENEEIKLWWASNVAHNLSKLVWYNDLVTLIWKDQEWESFCELCKNENINVVPLFMDSPTVVKIRFLDSQYKQQLLRVDYEKKEKISNDNIQKIKTFLEASNPSFIIISDYNKWIVTKEMVETVKEYVKKSDAKMLVDAKPVNLDLFYWAFLIKPNFKEFCEMVWEKWIENSNENVEKYWLDFVKKYETNLVVTRGWKWSTLITKDWNVSHIVSEERKVFDVSWAWDTYIATLTYALSEWYELSDAVKLANTASGIVVWKLWTACVTKEELWI